MRVIGEKLDQLESIVTRVLNFAKAPTSLHARHQVAEVVADTLVLVRLKLAQGDIRVSFEPPASRWSSRGTRASSSRCSSTSSSTRCRRCRGAGRSRSRLASEAREAGGHAVLEVSDTGSGIPDAIRGRIFDSFLSGRPDGTGLGLAIAKRVLLRHHGDIELVGLEPGGDDTAGYDSARARLAGAAHSSSSTFQ
jgi:nitrogen fixation/metabolism regulation signal transduction histidine kinase